MPAPPDPAQHLDRRGTTGPRRRRPRRRPYRHAGEGARRHHGRLLLALRRPPRAAGGDARHLGATQHRGGDRPRRARRRRPQDHGPASGALTFSRQLLPIDLAVRDWARRDRAVAKRLRRVDNRRMDYLRSQFASVTSDPDDVEARCLLAFSAAIGHYFIAAEHAGRSRAEVLDLAARRLFT